MVVRLPDFSEVHVLVIGDIMLDRAWQGDTSRISPEAPIPVVHVRQAEERPGGAANVALNISALGAKVSLIGVVGDDEEADTLQRTLTAANVSCHFQRLPDIPTITKLRILSRHQQLIRLDFEEKLTHINTKALLTEFKNALSQVQAVILSDYGKGTLVSSAELIKLARKEGIPTFVDPKSIDFSIYRGASIVTPNLKEFEAVVGPCQDEHDIFVKGHQLMRKQRLENLLITRGEYGMTLLQGNEPEIHLPTRAKEVYDVTGAGDTVIALLAASVAAGLPLPDAMQLANTAAGIVVGKLGAATVSVPELGLALRDPHTRVGGVITEEQLLLAVADARRNGEKIVMTNGCFDILHAGHVFYLEQAKKLGDRLIVAVNDDASVARLKGESRPINTLERRMAVLAGLGAVDWVVPFAEDTPERLICEVTPDILVKGGDYKPEDVAGGKHVMSHGGEVKILGFLPGHSTTSLIEKINAQQEVE